MHVRYRLKRHPVPIRAHFRHSLVLAYAFPRDVLAPLVPPGLELDAYGRWGLVAIGVVQLEGLGPTWAPPSVGGPHVLTGYRIFVRHHDAAGRMRRGLHILRSDADRRSMVWGGNTLTHYRYRHAAIRVHDEPGRLEVEVRTPGAEADLHVVADLAHPAAVPLGSPFADTADARRFAGPLPWTFDYEPETNSIVMVRGHRSAWRPTPVDVDVKQLTFLGHRQFGGATAVLANAFYIRGIDYRWDRGRRIPVVP